MAYTWLFPLLNLFNFSELHINIGFNSYIINREDWLAEWSDAVVDFYASDNVCYIMWNFLNQLDVNYVLILCRWIWAEFLVVPNNKRQLGSEIYR